MDGKATAHVNYTNLIFCLALLFLLVQAAKTEKKTWKIFLVHFYMSLGCCFAFAWSVSGTHQERQKKKLLTGWYGWSKILIDQTAILSFHSANNFSPLSFPNSSSATRCLSWWISLENLLKIEPLILWEDVGKEIWKDEMCVSETFRWLNAQEQDDERATGWRFIAL